MDGLPKNLAETPVSRAWRDFSAGRWESTIDVRDFIQRNVAPYQGDEFFLVGPSARTQAVWEKLQPYFEEERLRGVLDVDAATPSTVIAHAPGWIDQENEVIVGLQTDRPFRRAIFPAGGLRMVESGLKAAGFEADPSVHTAFTRYRKTHNDGVFDAYTPERHCQLNRHRNVRRPDRKTQGAVTLPDERRSPAAKLETLSYGLASIQLP